MSLQVVPGKLKGLSPESRARFELIDEYLKSEEPGLALELDGERGSARVIGTLPVDVGAGIRRDYKVEFRFAGLDPFVVPEAWDAGHHFPPDGDRHVEEHYSRGWRWCLWLPHSPEVDFSLPTGIKDFISRVRGFIFKQLTYEDRKRQGHPHPWPGPEWAHGEDGHVEWLQERLGSLNSDSLRRFRPFLTTSRLASKKQCPCGSGRKAGQCHRQVVDEIRTAMSPDLMNALDRFLEKRRNEHE